MEPLWGLRLSLQAAGRSGEKGPEDGLQEGSWKPTGDIWDHLGQN